MNLIIKFISILLLVINSGPNILLGSSFASTFILKVAGYVTRINAK
jgi:hypothetical protein